MKDVFLQCAQVLWDFSRLNQVPTRCQAMVVLGNDDPRCAEHAADLFMEGWAEFVVISGKEGAGTRGKLPRDKTEADVFCDIMTSRGVPASKVLLEKEATNTGENMRFSQRLLEGIGSRPKTVLIVTKSLMELRAALTFKKQWLGSESVGLCVSSPPLTLLEYPSPHVGSLEEVIRCLMEIFEKFTFYAQCGHQMPVDIPVYVQHAYSILATHKRTDC